MCISKYIFIPFIVYYLSAADCQMKCNQLIDLCLKASKCKSLGSDSLSTIKRTYFKYEYELLSL